jgi:hypothetical protein
MFRQLRGHFQAIKTHKTKITIVVLFVHGKAVSSNAWVYTVYVN